MSSESIGSSVLWLGFSPCALVVLVIDLGVLHPRSHGVGAVDIGNAEGGLG